MAPAMLPYLADRPVNLHRFPDGIDQAGLLAQGGAVARPGLAADAGATRTPTPARPSCYLVARLAGRAGLGRPTTAPSSCTRGRRRRDDPHQPTWAMIDIDPGTESTFDDVLVLARLHRTALEHLGVQAMPKVTGKRGIQIWVPVRRALHVRRHPGVGGGAVAGHRRTPSPTWSAGSGRWPKRGGRTRLDYTQNAINKTLVAPFSARPVAGAPVSVPITWDELDDPDLRPDRWTIARHRRASGRRRRSARTPRSACSSGSRSSDARVAAA